jgi:hypothetical protein
VQFLIASIPSLWGILVYNEVTSAVMSRECGGSCGNSEMLWGEWPVSLRYDQ